MAREENINNNKIHAADYANENTVSTEVEIKRFTKICGDMGQQPGIKLCIVKTYKNGVRKAKIGGQAIKKKNTWQWTFQGGELLELLKEKKLANFLKEMNADEKAAIKALQEKWDAALK